ncbi:MAG: hypothetical protein JXR10_08385 [Cyclobacteriaceae bacterium]
MFKPLIICIISTFTLIGCQPKVEKSQEDPSAELKLNSDFPKDLDKVFTAHGGYEAWSNMRALSFKMESKNELHQVSLWDRKSLISGPEKVIGYDGENVWLAPDTIEVGNARFYNGLFFYFFAMPFVLGDPGIIYEPLEEKDLMGKRYKGIKISYENGVGDAPKDNYILWYDLETYQMEWLMYTVTYGSDEASDSYRLIKYSGWTDFEGIKLPTSLEWYNYENDSVGAPRNERVFSEIVISQEPFDASLFSMPENARIAPLE